MQTLPRILPLSLPLLVLLLSACAVTVESAGVGVNPVNVAGSETINHRLGLQGYPGAVVVRQEQEDDESLTTFETGASLDDVYGYFHSQLTRRGWQRHGFEQKPNKVEADYRRRGEQLEFELQRHGRSGRYSLELKLDD